MGESRAVIHCNTQLGHQVRIANALKRGFDKNGRPAEISDKADTPAEFHVCMGPWFALDRWRKANTLYIDRAYWGDPDCVSVHWLSAGEKVFDINLWPRPHPALQPMREGDRSIYLCDYGDSAPGVDRYMYDTIRQHPAKCKPLESLESQLQRYQRAAGRRTTALVDAAIMGLQVETHDPYSPVYRLARGCSREHWIRNLAGHNWSIDEIASGEMWHVLGSNH